jgi:signal peptidase I
MAPTLHDGDVVIAQRGHRAIERGDVVVFRVSGRFGAPGDPQLRVKRVVAVAGEPTPTWVPATCAATAGGAVPAGCLVVQGDNIRSQDSRQLGFVSVNDVLGALRR